MGNETLATIRELLAETPPEALQTQDMQELRTWASAISNPSEHAQACIAIASAHVDRKESAAAFKLLMGAYRADPSATLAALPDMGNQAIADMLRTGDKQLTMTLLETMAADGRVRHRQYEAFVVVARTWLGDRNDLLAEDRNQLARWVAQKCGRSGAELDKQLQTFGTNEARPVAASGLAGNREKNLRPLGKRDAGGTGSHHAIIVPGEEDARAHHAAQELGMERLGFSGALSAGDHMELPIPGGCPDKENRQPTLRSHSTRPDH